MEADSIGDDLEPFLLDIMGGTNLEINSEILDDVYDSGQMLEQPRQEFPRESSVQNIPIHGHDQYQMQYFEEDSPNPPPTQRIRHVSEGSHNHSPPMFNHSPEFAHAYSPPFASSGNTPPQNAVEELQMNQVAPKQEQQVHQVPKQEINQPTQEVKQSPSNTVYIIHPVSVQNMKPADMGGVQRKPKKVERNKAHNAIEKRYRHSINDRIDDLRAILGGRDTKMSKSVVLRQAIEEITSLRKQNQQLKAELRKFGHTERQMAPFELCHSDFGSACDESPEPSPEPMASQHEPPLRIGGRNSVRSDITRMIYCISGIFALFMPFHQYLGGIFSPLKSADGGEFEVHSTGRVLMDESADRQHGQLDQAELANKLIKTWSTILLFVLLNGTIFLYLMYRGLVYMEPITSMDSSEYKQFQKSFAMAEQDFERHNLESSRARLNYCLSSLGRFRAQSTLEGIASVLWSLLLYFSNKTGVKWFVCCLASKLGSDAQSDSSKMAAMAYFMLAKVEFAETEKFKVPRASIVSYSAQSILLMEQAREKMTPKEMCSIYIQGSLIIRSLLPRFLSKVICRRINRRAADIARKTELEGSLAWLSHPLGETFLREPKLHSLSSSYCCSSMTLCPVATLSRAFRGHLFERITNALCNRYKHDMEEILELLTLLQTCSKSTNDQGYHVIDKTAYWWSVMLNWNLHENDPECPRDAVSKQVKSDMEVIINNIPSELNPAHGDPNPIQLLAVANYCSYKASVGDIPVDCRLGTISVTNETLQSSIQTLVVEQNKIDRITGLQLATVTADLILCIVEKSIERGDMEHAEKLTLTESARTTVRMMRNVLSLLPPTINRLEKWESFLQTVNDSNPVGIYATIRLFRDQNVNCDDHSSDSDSELSGSIELCAQTKVEARQLFRQCLPGPFMEGVFCEDKGIT